MSGRRQLRRGNLAAFLLQRRLGSLVLTFSEDEYQLLRARLQNAADERGEPAIVGYVGSVAGSVPGASCVGQLGEVADIADQGHGSATEAIESVAAASWSGFTHLHNADLEAGTSMAGLAASFDGLAG
ncbi:MAG: hypothetical protein LBR58_00985 [Propionibacteriaceae bacterium]|jgi:hypothetical protein|nr:hypothetical protein [Propionibacteriaceae bacterium]